MTAPCPDCFSGTVSEESPNGSTDTIHGLPTYVAQPEDGVKPKGLVVIVPDAFGWELVNNRVAADIYAKKGGFLVYVPDFMDGNAMHVSGMALMDKILKPASWLTTLLYKPVWIFRAAMSAIPFFYKNRLSVVKPRVFNFFQALRSSPPPFPTNNFKIAAAGFCFGGRYAILLAHDTPSSRTPCYSETSGSTGALVPLIDCAFAAHPSMVSVPSEIEAVTVPLSVTVGDIDMAMKSPQIQEMKAILEKKSDDHECVILPGAKHGFAIRMDPTDEQQMEFRASAERQAVNWFTRWLA